MNPRANVRTARKQSGTQQFSILYPFTIMAWNANAPTVSRLVGTGCLTCPDGSRVSGDDGLGALETLAKNIMVLKRPEFDGPKYPLGEIPVKEARSAQMGGDDYTIDYSFHIPNLHEIAMHNPNPTRSLATRVMDAQNNCGPDAIISNAYDMASIGCNPPRGRTGVMGKDVSPIISRIAPLEMGPFCITMFQNQDHLKEMFRAMEAHYPNAAMQVLGYQKIRDFIGTSHNLASATAGSLTPRFNPFQFIDRPDSVGSIEWFSEALDRISSYATSRDNWRVSMSRRLFRRWMIDYAKKHEVTLNVDFANLNQQVGNFIIQGNGQDSVSFITDRLNTRYTIEFTKDPIYVTDNQIGEDAYEWQFQPWFTTRAGDDTRTGEAAGYVREKNQDYGAACSACPDGHKSLSELILIYNDEYISYEALPKSPFAGLGLEHVATDLQALWGSMELRYYFGSEVDEYFLRPLFAGTGNCPSNIDNTWFAARLWFAFRQRILRKRAAGALLVKVPRPEMVNVAEGDCLQSEYPDPIVLTNREPQLGSRECVVVDEEEITDEVGFLRPDCYFTLTAPEEDQTIQIEVERRDGFSGALELDYTMTEGTATAPEHYTTASGSLDFAEGQTRRVLEIVIKAADCVAAEDVETRRFTVEWTGAGLGEGVCTETVIDIVDRVCGDGEEVPS
jgi:hypothetical protein